MILTEREKEIVEEVAALHDNCTDAMHLTVYMGDVVAMFGLFLSRIREEQEERKGYECVHCGMIYPDHPVSSCDCLEAGQKQAFHNVVISRVPPAAPCDCSELVEALERLARLGNEPNYGNSIGNDIAKQALANHAKRMNGE